jgi:ABC-type Na+ efflux pump permease subunit
MTFQDDVMRFWKSYAIAIKDLTEVFTSVEIYGPMIGVPVFFAIMLPFLTFYVTQHSAGSVLSKLIATPASIAGISASAGLIFMTFFSISVLGPIFLTMPILTASVIAADSFAGEKERKTSEALLATPVTRSELLLGKIIASFVPTVILTVAVFAIYGYITNYLSLQIFQQSILPTPAWLLMLLSSPFLAIVTIGIVVLVSSHVRGVKESQQISTLLVLPILIMPFAAILGIANLSVGFFEWLIVVLAFADALIIYLGVKSFRKEFML